MNERTTVSNVVTFYFDPERMFEFARVPNDIPQRFSDQLYPRLWEWWLKNRKIDRAGYLAAVAEIRARQNGWCSVWDITMAGYTQSGERMAPEEIVNQMLQEIIALEPAA